MKISKKNLILLISLFSVCVLTYLFLVFYKADEIIPVGTTQVANLTNNGLDYPDSTVLAPKIPKYEKFELTFDINRLNAPGGTVTNNLNTEIDASTINPYWPYDPAPAANTPENIASRGDGKEPVQSKVGISVDGLFSNDNWATTITQPGFIYQDYEKQIVSNADWIYPKGVPVWKIRFAPTAEGNWQYRIKIRDLSGLTEYTPANNTLAAVTSTNKGFVKVSPTDSRYFETSDGQNLNLVGISEAGLGTIANIENNLVAGFTRPRSFWY